VGWRVDVGESVRGETQAGNLKLVATLKRRRQFALYLPAEMIFDGVGQVDNPAH
jgi:hypothetical protein